MNALQLWHLKRLCDKHDIDYQEIDSEISYSENKSHIESLVIRTFHDFRDVNKEDMAMYNASVKETEAQWKEYIENNFLSFYVMCQRYGETQSEEVGAPIPSTRFSLREWVNR